jgi:hypothetical protein
MQWFLVFQIARRSAKSSGAIASQVNCNFVAKVRKRPSGALGWMMSAMALGVCMVSAMIAE